MDNRDIHVLSIEDNPGDAMLIEEKLTTGTRIGWDLPTFTVERVNRLQQGLARLKATASGEVVPIDVVLTDLDLPDSQAAETFKTLRQRFPYLPIVVLTGREDVDLARTSVQAGAQDYLYKDEATGSLLAHSLIYAIERQENARALQKAHDELEARVTARTHELRERLKELTCLYAINRDLQADLSKDKLCQRTVENLAAAMAFPDLAIPVIDLDNRRYTIDPEPDGTSAALRAPIKVGGEVRGHVQVTYAEAQPFLLPEEQHLVEGVAEALSTWLARKQAEAQTRFQAQLLDSVRESVVATDLEGKVIYWGRGAESLYGWSAEEVLGKAITFIVDTREVEREQARMRRAIETGQWHGEYRQKRKDGSSFWSDTSISRVRDEDGCPTGLIGIDRDITARKQAESQQAIMLRALRANQERLRMTVDLAPIGVGIVDSRGNLIDCNTALAEIVGYDRNALLQMHYADFTHPEDLKREEQLIEDLWEGTATEYRLEKRYIHRDGYPVWVDVTAFLFKDERSERACGFAFVQDLSEQATTHRALEEHESRFRMIVENSTNLFYAHTSDHELTYVSPQVRDYLDCEPEEAMVRWTEFTTDNPVNQKGIAATERAIATGEAQPPFELELISKRGRSLWVEVREAPVVDEDETVAIVGSLTDITARKQATEKLKTLTRQFESFLDNTPALIALFDHDGRYLLTNQATLEVLQLTEAQVVGQTFADLLPPEAAHTFMTRVRRLERVNKMFAVEDRLWVEGEERVYQTILFPIQETPNMFGSVAIDITEPKRTEEALRRTTERLRIEHEIDTAILQAQSAEEITRAALERLHNLIPCRHVSITEFDPSREHGRERIVIAEGEMRMKPSAWHPLTNAGPHVVDDLLQGRAIQINDLVALEVHSALQQSLVALGIRAYVSVPLRVQDVPIGTLNAASDVPGFFKPEHVEILEEVAASLAVALQQAHLLEQTQQDAETKTLLLREVNHRVKNNLDAIIGLLYVERRFAPPEALPAYQPIIEDLTRRITGLAQVHQMLSETEWTPLSLSELAERIIQTPAPSWVKDLRIRLDVESSPVRIQPDQAQHLALILSELATNTLKYAVADRETVNVAVRISQEGDTIQLVYQNDGPGYPEDVLNLERHNAGFDIIKRSVEKNLRGELILRNDNGAVTIIRFPREDGD